jgi:hypothetical protein
MTFTTISDRAVRLRALCALVVLFGLPAASLSLAHVGRAQEAPAADWPFTPLQAPAPPATVMDREADSAVDGYVLAEQVKKGLHFAPEADRLTLLRRVTFDLTGSLPTPEECDAFLADRSPDAYEQLIDRLLNSPEFGERWAQHWLDVVRYAETDGYKLDRSRPDAYRYRDYVIRAFNRDVPYDVFVQQQLAGDELSPQNPEAQVATGFLRLPPEELLGADYRRIRQELLDDITDVVGQSFLGLTVGCARCHDHKFDDISQREYYQLQAFFAATTQRDEVLTDEDSAEAQQYREQLAKWEQATENVRRMMNSMIDPFRTEIMAEVLPSLDDDTQVAMKMDPQARDPRQQQLASLAEKQLRHKYAKMHRRLDDAKRAEYDELAEQLTHYDQLKPQPLPSAMASSDVGPIAPVTHCLDGGDYLKPGDEVQPGFLSLLSKESPKIAPPAERPQSTGRRSALARWLTRPDHPLTARVMVNRLWQHYFGRGIVASPNNFGVMGETPENPELLDFLAAELVGEGWQLKEVHREILVSAVYRQSSIAEQNKLCDKAENIDPENDLLWHAPLRRRDAESIRDAAIVAAEEDNSQMYGPSVLPELPAALHEDRYAWEPSPEPGAQSRRSVYLLVKRNLQYPLFAAFDHPNRVATCAARPTTIGAPQALLLLNGEFLRNTSRRMAGDLLRESNGTPPALLQQTLIEQAYDRTYNRSPQPEEMQAARRFLRDQTLRIQQAGSPPESSLPDPLPTRLLAAEGAALVDFCQALMNSAEFVYVD